MVHLQSNFQHYGSGNCSKLLKPRSLQTLPQMATDRKVSLHAGKASRTKNPAPENSLHHHNIGKICDQKSTSNSIPPGWIVD
jgi:hypothetical protein